MIQADSSCCVDTAPEAPTEARVARAVRMAAGYLSSLTQQSLHGGRGVLCDGGGEEGVPG